MHALIIQLALCSGILCLAGAQIQIPGGVNPLGKKAACTCGVPSGTPDTRIVGGTEARPNNFPWRAALYTKSGGRGGGRGGHRGHRGHRDNRNQRNQSDRRGGHRGDRGTSKKVLFCGGTLISPNWVLTANHCVRQMRISEIWVGLGNHDLRKTEANSQEKRVTRVIMHKDYNKSTLENDIALLQLDSPATINNYVYPVCLPFGMEDKNLDGSKVVASGWGVTRSGAGDSGKELRKVVMDVISNTTCNNQYRGYIKKTMMCTLTTDKDTCQGDSGSGIDYYARQSQTQCVVGVVSFGDECAKRDKGGVYTRVTSFLDWIQSQTGADFCKNCNP